MTGVRVSSVRHKEVRRLRGAAAAAVLAAVAAVFAGFGAGDAAAEPAVRLLCDDRAHDWGRHIVACPKEGTAYPEIDGWRDGVLVELSGFSHTEKPRNPKAAIDHWWFGEDGTLLRSKKATIAGLNPGALGAALFLQSGGVFTGRMNTLPPSLIEPRRYTLLFQARVPCDRDDRVCWSTIRDTPLREEFRAALPEDPPFNLVRDNPGTRSQFAWAEIRILPGERPGIDPGAFNLICQPLGSPCVAGSPFYFETRGPVRQLDRGGCIKFSREGEPLPVRAALRDDKGNPVFGPKEYRMSGFGNMPAAGTWKAHFDCYGGPPVLFGEYVLSEGPRQPPPPPPAVPSTKFDLKLSIGRKTLPHTYNGPYPAFGAGEVYPGMEVRLEAAQPSGWNLYAHGRPQRYDIFLDGEELTWSYESDWGASFLLPAALAEGPHRLTLRATRFSEGKKIEFEGSLDVQGVGTPERPRLSVLGRVETDQETAAVVSPAHPTMEVESVEVADPGNMKYRIEASSATDKGSILLGFRIPLETVWQRNQGGGHLSTEREVRLRVSFRQRLAGTAWHRFHAEYPVRVGLVCRREPRPAIEVSPATVVLRSDSSVSVTIAGFPCGDRVRVLSEGEGGERIDWGAEGRLAPAGDVLQLGVDGDASVALRGLEARLTPRKPERHVFIARDDSGVEARHAVTVAPAAYIEVGPDRPKAGERIRIRPFGFRAGVYAHVFLGEARLTPDHGKPLEAGEALEVRLPEEVAGRQTIRLVDNAGNRAEDTIEIEGDGAQAACTEPCVVLPPRAAQGERFDTLIGGFARNEQLVVRFAELFEVAKPYQRDLMVKQEVPVPRDLRDGRYAVTVYALTDPTRAARREIAVEGGYRPPEMAIPCPRNQSGCSVPQFAPGESLRTTGLGWAVKARFGGLLIPERGPARAIEVARDGCLWGFVDGTAQGRPCDEETGEIDKYWELPEDLPGGACLLEVSDGASSARAEFRIAVVPVSADPPGKTVTGSPPDEPLPVKEPGEPVSPPPPQPPVAPPVSGAKQCDPDLPKLWQPGCVEAGSGGGAGRPGSQPPPQAICEPGRPRYAQPGCVEASLPPGTREAPGAPRKCDPNVPSYAQPGCIP